MSGCGCGQPVIVTGTQAPARVDVEALLLCDVLADGTVAATVLVEPVYDTSTGQRIATRLVDPTTGTPYTPTGTLGVCQPSDECARQISTRTRCDDADGDGTGEIAYVEVWALDPCDGGAPTLLGTYQDGDFTQPYTPVAPVDCPETVQDTPVVLGTICYLGGAGDTRTAAVLKCAACTDTTVTYLDVETGATVTAPTVVSCAPPERSTVLLCDVLADGTSAPFLRHYSDDGTGTTFTDTLLDGATAYTTTGTVGTCQPVSDCASPTTPLTSVGLCLADGTPIAVTVVRDCDGVTISEGWINLTTGAWTAGTVPAGTVACGDSQSVQVSGTFCDVDAAGEVVGLVLVEYSYAADGTIDSVRLVDAVTGTTYTPTGTVTVCPAGVEQPEQDAVVLCDTAADGTVTQFLRDYRRDELGAIVAHSDYLLDGTAYTPTGTVGVCAEPCLNCETIELCDSAPLSPTLSVTATDWACRYVIPVDFAAGQCPNCRINNPDDGQAFWDGGQVVFPNRATDPDCGNTGTHLGIAGVIRAATDCPDCFADDDLFTVTVTGASTNNGPGAGVITDGRVNFFLDDGTHTDGTIPQLVPQAVDANRGPNTTWNWTLSAQVSWADLKAGRLVVTLDHETKASGALKQWTAQDFTLTAVPVAPKAGCGTTFHRVICRDCTGAIVSTTDYEPDGVTPYTPVGAVGACLSCPPAGAEACLSCETLLLCDVSDDPPATISGTAGSGTLANGVTWTATGPNGGNVQPPNRSNSDGSWWGLHSFPFTTTSPTMWTFSRPSVVEFSVYVRYNPTNPAINTAQLPVGLEVVTLPDGYAYNATTGVLTRTSDPAPADLCTYVTDPQIETSARFRTAGPVTSLTTAPAPNSRVAACGIFFTYYAGALAVSPGGPFLRHICRDCDGAVSSVTDTELDGQTAYTPAGTVGQCGTQNTEPAYDVEPLLLCDTATDGSATEFLRHYVYTDASGTPASHQDTALDGTTAYTPTGTVGQCQPAECEFTPICVRPSGRVEFLSNPGGATSGVDADWTWGQSLAGPWFPTYRVGVYPGWTTVDPGTAEGTAHWIAPHPDSQLANTGQPGEGPAITAGTPDWYGRASFQLPSFADPATIRISATALNADQLAVEWRLNGGAWQSVNRNHTQPPYTLAPTGVPGAQAGVNEIVVHVQETVFPTGAAGILLHVIAEYDVDASAYLQWTQVVCTDGSMYFLDELGARQDALPDGSTIVPCPGSGEACTTVQLRQLCDLVYSPQPPIPTLSSSFTLTGNVQVTGAGLYYSGGNAAPNGIATLPLTGLIANSGYDFRFSTSWAGLGRPNPALADAVYLVEALDGTTVIASQQRNISNGASAAPGWVEEDPFQFTAPASGMVTLRITDKSTGNGIDRDLIIVPTEVRSQAQTVAATPFLRAYTYDCTGRLLTTTDTELDGSTAYTLQGEAGICSGTSGATLAPDTCAKTVVERCGCDDTDGDGIGDVQYTELWAVDPCNGEDPVLLGTFLDGDLTQPYTPVAPVDCTAAEALPGPLSTGVRAVTGTAAQDIAAAFPGLQSVSLSVLSGVVNATMSDGTAVAIPAGVTMTWSVAQDSDTALAAASFAGAAAGATYLLNWTWK